MTCSEIQRQSTRKITNAVGNGNFCFDQRDNEANDFVSGASACFCLQSCETFIDLETGIVKINSQEVKSNKFALPHVSIHPSHNPARQSHDRNDFRLGYLNLVAISIAKYLNTTFCLPQQTQPFRANKSAKPRTNY